MVSRMEKDIKDMKELSEAKKVQDKKNMALQEERERSRNYVKSNKPPAFHWQDERLSTFPSFSTERGNREDQR